MVQAINTTLRRVPPLAIYIAGVLPLAWLVWLLFSGALGVDPVKRIEHQLGEWALQLLVAGLAITPLRRFTGVNLIRYRRAIGLLAFFYVALHLGTWLVLDIQLRWAEIWADIVKRPYITVGFAGFVAMIPLAITSNNESVRRLGAKTWQNLHRLTYFAVLAGAVHYMWLVKAWPPEPIIYLILVIFLLATRLVPKKRA
ncbi:protein-methionine-sulfoxide reductase heme-binding subunit MsrQ [Pseudorhodobacter sp. E13]|uniref:protein-methionine-sulfoxide reductase heme-binding subunit MsrQ n=1 Tax=Pseudorhodobacter sp. E13 TaxID=2487931 RepID=UPI000F8EF755|nr:protein-methionine-sulfoxide reductase heme-binding subunit MsrQ [Pseudorhodobacter sp. E13]RUS65260.1 protein-methionine-sulfoxide reductase heme-binding subunit MsrQ [Pseudorhodobacter sp. E13]